MTDDDIFCAAAEIYDERSAICCEAGLSLSVAESIAAKEALAYIDKHRGQEAADRLRADALKEIGK